MKSMAIEIAHAAPRIGLVTGSGNGWSTEKKGNSDKEEHQRSKNKPSKYNVLVSRVATIERLHIYRRAHRVVISISMLVADKFKL